MFQSKSEISTIRRMLKSCVAAVIAYSALKLYKNTRTECVICLDKGNIFMFSTYKCGHSCCYTCLDYYLHYQMGDKTCYPLKCFYCMVNHIEINELPSATWKIKYRYWQLLAENKSALSCAYCQTEIIVSNSNPPIDVLCHECHQTSCTQCEKPSHVGKEQCPLMINQIKAQLQLEQCTLENKFAKCPGCGFVVEKQEGCNHMRHINCCGTETTHFCYLCNETLNLKNISSHFPNGVFDHCVNSEKIEADRFEQKQRNAILRKLLNDQEQKIVLPVVAEVNSICSRHYKWESYGETVTLLPELHCSCKAKNDCVHIEAVFQLLNDSLV